MILMIIGVSGCGKTTLGKKTAELLGLNYYEADNYHPPENIEKMSRGFPLNDEDRFPWLMTIKEEIIRCQKEEESAVFSCSALKEKYRALLMENLKEPVEWVYLKGSFAIIRKRMLNRENHFFKEEMLQSQFDTLEEPDYGLVLDIDMPLEKKVKILSDHFNLLKSQ